jgi:AcrR family transcriptional regulator
MVSEAAASIPPFFDAEPERVARVLRAAYQLLFTYGYQAFTMDELAHELGVSKKTLYVHFASKDALIERIIDLLGASLRSRMEAVVQNPALTLPEKVSGVVAVATTTLGKANPSTLRELQRFAPRVYRKIEDLRGKVIPLVFGQLIRTGVAQGVIRSDVDPAFATEFGLQAIRGLVQPAALERTQLTVPQTLEKALHLLFAGLLTPAGRKDYEKRR